MTTRQLNLEDFIKQFRDGVRKIFDPGPNAHDRNALVLLETTLAAAVPMWCHEMRSWSPERRVERAQVCAQYVAEHGDVILYKGKGTAEAFNRLAEGIAICAFQPNGVRIFNLHFEANDRGVKSGVARPNRAQRRAAKKANR